MTLPTPDATAALHGLALAATKAGGVLLLAAAATTAMRRASAAARHLVWTLAVAVAVLMPAAASLTPAWRVPVLPPPAVATPAGPPSAVPTTVALPLPTGGAAAAAGSDPPTLDVGAPPAPPSPARAASPAVVTVATPGRRVIDWPVVALAAWAAGATAVALSWAVGVAAARRLARSAAVVGSGPLLDGVRSTQAELGGLRRSVTVRVGGRVTTPLTAGILHPTLLLPADCDGWPAERLRAVLLHELAHVRRHDCATQLLAHVCCAVHWFNPLAWAAAARMRAERERACDDVALRHGADPAGYAGVLVSVAAAIRGRSLPAVLPMARRSGLGGRVRTVLDATVNRRPVRRRLAAVATVVAAVVLVPLAAVRLAPRLAHAAPVDQATSQPAGPAQTLVDLVAALKRRQVRRAVECFDCPDDQRTALAVQMATASADMRLKDAVVARFGAAAATGWLGQGDTSADAERAAAAATVRLDGETATARPPGGTTDDEFHLRRVAGRWKLAVPPSVGRRADLTGLKFAAAKNRLAAEITDGRVSTVAAAQAEYQTLFAAADADLGDLALDDVAAIGPATRPAAAGAAAANGGPHLRFVSVLDHGAGPAWRPDGRPVEQTGDADFVDRLRTALPPVVHMLDRSAVPILQLWFIDLALDRGDEIGDLTVTGPDGQSILGGNTGLEVHGVVAEPTATSGWLAMADALSARPATATVALRYRTGPWHDADRLASAYFTLPVRELRHGSDTATVDATADGHAKLTVIGGQGGEPAEVEYRCVAVMADKRRVDPRTISRTTAHGRPVQAFDVDVPLSQVAEIDLQWREVRTATWADVPLAAVAAPAASQPATRAAATPTLALLVLDAATRAPLAGATAGAVSSDEGPVVTTGVDGRAAVAVAGAGGDYAVVDVRRAGYVGKRVDCSQGGVAAPGRYTVELTRGRTIGGRATDDAGRPVAGAHVVVETGGERIGPREWRIGEAEVRTGADGRWTFDGAPATLGSVQVGVWDYGHVINDAGNAWFDRPAYAPVSALADGTATFVLHDGVAVAGVVLGPDGRPVRGAQVGFGGDRVGSTTVPALETGDDGRFAFAFRPGTPVVLTVTAKGDAPELLELKADHDRRDVTVRLTAGRTLAGQVVGPDGRRVPNPFVSIDTWRGRRTLGDLRVPADAEGRFRWDDAPADAVLANVGGHGLMDGDRVPLLAGGANVVRLRGRVHVSGTVTDAATGRPVAAFRVVHGYAWAKGRDIYYDPDAATTGQAGRFAFELGRPQTAYGVRVEASGYLPAESRPFTMDEPTVALDLKLTPAANWRAKILRPDGAPAAGAVATLVPAGGAPFTFYGDVADAKVELQHLHFAAAADGTVTMPPQRGSAAVVVVDESGFAAVTDGAMAVGTPIQLQRWAAIHGRIAAGGSPAGGQRACLASWSPGGSAEPMHDVDAYIRATADVDGRFTINCVPPGRVSIGRYTEQSDGTFTRLVTTARQALDLAPGQVTDVTIEGFAPTTVTTTAPARAAPAATQAAGRTLDLLVLDGATRQPISGAEANPYSDDAAVRSGEDGHAPVPVPADVHGHFGIVVSERGYVAKSISWPPRNAPDGEPVPDRYTVSLERGQTIGGRVVDEAGQPVGGAHVVIDATGPKLADAHERSNVSYATAESGGDGRWSFDGLPRGARDVSVGVWRHGSVNNAGTYGFYDVPRYADVAPLLAGTATFTLKRGLALTGTVLGPDGRSVAGARVGQGTDRVASNVIPAVATGPDGRFAMAFNAGDEVVLTATAPGDAPEMARLTMGAAPRDITIRLTAGHRLAGRVVDVGGRPVARAYVWIDAWRSCRTVGRTLRTDADGRFGYDEAPADAVLADVQGPGEGFMRQNRVPLTAGAANVVRLARPLHVEGTITDAATGQPIPEARLVHGLASGGDRATTWQVDRAETVRGGRFAFDEKWPWPAYAVRVEAAGHVAAESRVYQADEGTVTLDLKLQPATDWRVTLAKPDGTPAAGAVATLVLSGGNTYQFQGDLVDRYPDQRHDHFTAGPDGTVTLPPQPAQAKLVVVNRDGWLVANQDVLRKGGTVPMSAWATVRGRALVGRNPAAGCTVGLTMSATNGSTFDPGEPQVTAYMTATADADGRFAFDHVPPGAPSVGRVAPTVGNGRSSGRWTQTQSVDAAAGRTTDLTLGGQGRPVVGKLVVPDALAKRSDWTWGFDCVVRTQVAFPAMPALPEAVTRPASPEAARRAMEAFTRTDAYRAYQAATDQAARGLREYPLEIHADGGFRVDDVPAGTYVLTATAVPDGAAGSRRRAEPIGTASATFTVPAMADGRDDAPLELPPAAVVLRR